MEEYQKRFLKLKQFAISKGGQLLSDKYIGVNHKYKFKCKNEHEFEKLYNNLKKVEHNWCNTCKKWDTKEEQRINRFYLFKSTIENKNGRCLSSVDDYVDKKTQILIECEFNHQWSSTFGSIVEKGSWCIQCGKNDQKYDYDYFVNLANRHNFELIDMEEEEFRDIWITKTIFICNKCKVPRIVVAKNLKNCLFCEKYNEELMTQVYNKIEEEKAELIEEFDIQESGLKYLKIKCNFHGIFIKKAEHIASGDWCKKCSLVNSQNGTQNGDKIEKYVANILEKHGNVKIVGNESGNIMDRGFS